MKHIKLLPLLLAIISPFSSAQSAEDIIRTQQTAAQAGQTDSSSNSVNTIVSNSAVFESSTPQTIGAGRATGLPQTGTYEIQPRTGLLLPGETDIRDLLPAIDDELSPPYGANIFAGGYETERVDGLNENYLIAPGDKLSIWLWGAVNFNDVVTVDNQGNIFIPNIGPISVLNVPANNINKLVTSKVKSIYKRNVQIYVNLMTATPISLFISGSVIRPGQYAGMASDSLLYFLKRAGGVDSDRGSYREIKILRNGEVLANVDLYNFIRSGRIPNISFKDKDVIFVSEQKSSLNVTGKVKNPFRFEFPDTEFLGKDVIELSKPLTNTSHVAVMGNRENEPFSIYLPMKEFETFTLLDGDKVFFNEDLHAQIYDIEIMGSHLGPSYYAVKKNTRLHDLLSHIEVDKKLADYSSIYIMRESVKLEQQEILNKSLDRLERSVYFAPTSSTGEASIRSQEAKLVSEFVERARKAVPLGKVVVSEGGKIANIALEQGDKIVIPQKTDLVQIGGEVLMPQAVVYNENATLEDYIAWAGGYSDRADYAKLVVIHANGLADFVEMEDTWFQAQASAVLSPGDKILVLPKIEAKTMQTVKDFTQILYQIAVTANAID